MKTNNVKKLFAAVAAIATVASSATLSAFAATQEWTGASGDCDIVIGQVTVDTDELAAASYKVPVVIKVTPNPGITTLEFGFKSALNYTIADDADAYTELATASGVKLKAAAECDTKKNGDDYVTWAAWGSSSPKTYEEYILAVFEVPSTAQPGDEFPIQFLNTGLSGNKLICEAEGDDGKTEYTVNGVDGFIRIVAGETTTSATTTTETTTSTTTTETTTTSTSTSTSTTTTTTSTSTSTSTSTTTTTAAPIVTTAKPTAPSTTATTTTTFRYVTATLPKATTRARSMNPHIDNYYTQTTYKAVPAATARTATTGTSPKTGASDVLPIAGAAAAVAVLGGVALVSKKKND